MRRSFEKKILREIHAFNPEGNDHNMDLDHVPSYAGKDINVKCDDMFYQFDSSIFCPTTGFKGDNK
jgi:hypothetical protein